MGTRKDGERRFPVLLSEVCGRARIWVTPGVVEVLRPYDPS